MSRFVLIFLIGFILATPAHSMKCFESLRTGLAALFGKRSNTPTTVEHSRGVSDGAHSHLITYEAQKAELIRLAREQIGSSRARKAYLNLESKLKDISVLVKSGDLIAAYAELKKITSIEGLPIQISFDAGTKSYTKGPQDTDTVASIMTNRHASGLFTPRVDDHDVFSANVEIPAANIRLNGKNVDLFDPSVPNSEAVKAFRLEQILASFEEFGHLNQLLRSIENPNPDSGFLSLRGTRLQQIKKRVDELHLEDKLHQAKLEELEEADVYAYLIDVLGEENVGNYYALTSSYPSRDLVDRLYRQR